MNYERFIKEQTALTDLSVAYRDDPKFRASVDANPKSILTGTIAECEGEVVIMQNTAETFYFVLSAEMSQILDDEETNTIAAAKLSYVSDDYSREAFGFRQVLHDTETGGFYRRYKKDPDDPLGETHFVQVHRYDDGTYAGIRDVGPVIVR